MEREDQWILLTVKSTAVSIIKVLSEINPNFAPTAGKIVFYGKDGGDGAGTMPHLKSKKSAEDAEHIFQYGFISLRITQISNKGEEIEVWKNQYPSSARSLQIIIYS